MMASLFVLLLLGAPVPTEESLRARFIGNAGFEISDGSHTILIDFPYVSGAFGYMTYDPGEVRSRDDSLCLFTHGHADHFDARSLPDVGCAVAGPAEVVGAAEGALRLEGGPKWSFGEAAIQCIDSEHGETEHCSYLLTWHGKQILVAGDVETLGGLLELIEAVDVAIIPEWLGKETGQVRERFPGATILLDHFHAGARVPPCDECVVPQQSETFSW